MYQRDLIDKLNLSKHVFNVAEGYTNKENKESIVGNAKKLF